MRRAERGRVGSLDPRAADDTLVTAIEGREGGEMKWNGMSRDERQARTHRATAEVDPVDDAQPHASVHRGSTV